MTKEKYLEELKINIPGNTVGAPINCGAGLAIDTDDGSKI